MKKIGPQQKKSHEIFKIALDTLVRAVFSRGPKILKIWSVTYFCPIKTQKNFEMFGYCQLQVEKNFKAKLVQDSMFAILPIKFQLKLFFKNRAVHDFLK